MKVDPSRGGTGIKLKTNSAILRVIALAMISSEFGTIRARTKPTPVATRAMARLERGPAAVMIISSLIRVFGLGSDISTGFPHPSRAMPMEPPKMSGPKMISKGKKTVPSRSMWASGLRVTLPWCAGSGSPLLSAAKA